VVFKAIVQILENIPPRIIFKPFICLYVWAIRLMEKSCTAGCPHSITTSSGIGSGVGFFHQLYDVCCALPSFLGMVFLLMFPDRSF